MNGNGIFSLMIDAMAAWNQIAYALGGLVCLTVGGGLIGIFAYEHLAGTKVRGRIAAVRVKGAPQIAAMLEKTPDKTDFGQDSKPKESFGEMFRQTPGQGIAAIIVLLLVLGIPLTFVGFGAWMGINYIDLTRNGVAVQATVVDNEYSHSSDSGGSYHAVVSFNDSSGLVHQVKDHISIGSSPSFDTGSTVMVHYDPNDPERAIIGGVIHNLLPAMAFSGFGALFLFIIFGASHFKGRRRAPGSPAKISYSAGEMYYPVYEYKDRGGNLVRADDDSGSNWIGNKAPGTPVWLYVNPGNPQKVTRAGLVLPALGLVFAVPGILFLYLAFSLFKFNMFTVLFIMGLLAMAGLKLHRIMTPENMRLAREAFVNRKAAEKQGPEEGRELTAEEIRVRLRAAQKSSAIATPILSLIGVGIVTLGLYLGHNMADLLASGQRASGEVVRMESSYSSNSTSYYAVVGFDIPGVGHREFRDSVGSNPPTHRTGDEVTVLYDPANPGHAMIDRGVWNWAPASGCIAGGVLLLAMALQSLINARRIRRL